MVKQIRYMIAAVLIFLVLFLSCDLFNFYMYSFEDFYYTSFYVQKEKSTIEMLREIQDRAKKYDVQVFFVDKEIQGNFQTDVAVYGNRKTENYLENEYYVEPGRYKSLFSGSTTISYHNFDSLSKSTINGSENQFYMIGEKNHIFDFKASLVDEYGGSLPHLEGRNSRHDIEKELLLLWTVIIGILLIFTYYRVVLLKKEFLIRLSLGESALQVVASNVITDTIIFAGIYGASAWIASCYSGRIFLFQESTGLFALFLIVNATVYFDLFRVSIRRNLSNERMNRKLLDMNYLFKFVLTLCISISLASNILFFYQYYCMKSQEEFYEQRSDYAYVQLTQYNLAEISNLESLFYYRFFRDFDIQFDCSCLSYDASDNMAVCMNANMKEYLVHDIPDIRNKIKESRSCLIVPKGIDLSKDEIAFLKDAALSLSGDTSGSVPVITYSKSVNLTVYNILNAYSIEKNPVILYSNRTDWSGKTDFKGCIPLLSLNRAFSKVDKDKLNAFCKEQHCSYQLTNVNQEFSYELTRLERGFVLNVVLFVIQLLAEVFLIIAVIRLEFEANRLELLLKKILGSTKIERIFKLYLITSISGLTGVVLVYMIGHILELAGVVIACSGVLAFMVLEYIIISVVFARQEQDNIQRTLKGGY